MTATIAEDQKRGGKAISYVWQFMSYDLETGQERVMAEQRFNVDG
jgi:hypothetical protein